MPRHKVEWIPKLDKEKVMEELEIDESTFNKIKELVAEADASNMLVNEFIGRLSNVLTYQTEIAELLDVTPTTISKRIHNEIGQMDRVHPTTPKQVGDTKAFKDEEERHPYVSELRRVLSLFGVYGTVIDRIIRIYTSRPNYYDTEHGFFQLLRDLNFSKSRAGLLTMHFFDLPYKYEPTMYEGVKVYAE